MKHSITRRSLMAGAAALATHGAFADTVTPQVGGGIGPGVSDGGVIGGVNSVPAWLNGYKVGINFALQKAYVRGKGYVPISSVLSVTRARNGTATSSTNAISYVGNNLPAISDLGLQSTWESTKNLILNTGDFSAAPWSTFNSGTGGAVTVTPNAGLAPDGTMTAALITISRTTTTGFSEVFQNFSGSVAAYSGQLYLRAAPGSEGKFISTFLGKGSGTPFNTLSQLQSFWQPWSVLNQTLAFVSNCQLGCGFINVASGINGNQQIGSVSFYAWGGYAGLGATVPPYNPNAGTSTTQPADVVQLIGDAAAVLGSPTASIAVWTNSSDKLNTAQTLIDANGTVLLGKDASNKVVSAVGSALASSNVFAPLGVNNFGFSWDASGGLINLIGTTTTDVVARTPSGPFYLGSTGGTSNFWNGSIGCLLLDDTKQAAPQCSLPAGVMPGFITNTANSRNPAGTQFRDFSGKAVANGGAPLYLPNTDIYNTRGVSGPYPRESVKSGSTYIGLAAAANGATSQSWVTLLSYTGSDPLTWTLNATNPAIQSGGGLADSTYLLHTAITKGCALAPFVAYYSAFTAGTVWGIYAATSTDGITWTKVGSTPVIASNAGAGYPNPGLPSILEIGSTLHMYVVSNGNAGTVILHFTSPTSDGLTWTYVGVALAAPAATDWDAAMNNGLIDPWVIKNKHGFYEMVYTAGFTGSPGQIVGYAVSADGYTFTRSPSYLQGPVNYPIPGDGVLLERSDEFVFMYDESNATTVVNPYAYTLPPY